MENSSPQKANLFLVSDGRRFCGTPALETKTTNKHQAGPIKGRH
jgi:hypothetical protein